MPKTWKEIIGRYFYIQRTPSRLHWIEVVARYMGINLDDKGSLGQVFDYCLQHVALHIQNKEM